MNPKSLLRGIIIMLAGVMGLMSTSTFFSTLIGVGIALMIISFMEDDVKEVNKETTNIVSPEMQMTDEEMKEANKEYE